MKIRNSLILLLTATIWGFAFVAQSVGMDYVGPLTFLFSRSLIGGIVLLPVVAILHKNGPGHASETPEEKRKARKTLLIGGVCCGVALCAADLTQQIGLLHTTVGKSGFFTSCYILIVPLINLLFFRRRCSRLVWGGDRACRCRDVLPLSERRTEHQHRRPDHPCLCGTCSRYIFW